MGDGLKLSKDKRHRSSSSLAGAAVEGTRSERKLDLTESIAEVDDQFALAEARCENLQEKIDLVKVIKKKKKLKKLSMTRVNEVPVPPENMSFITVKTQPKKKAVQSRLRRQEAPSLDFAAEEQRRMLGQMSQYNETYYEPQEQYKQTPQSLEPNIPRTRDRRARADGDRVMRGRSVQIDGPALTPPSPHTQNDTSGYDERFDRRAFLGSGQKTPPEVRTLPPKHSLRRRHVPKEVPDKTVREKWKDRTRERAGWVASADQRGMPKYDNLSPLLTGDEPGERPVVELYSNSMKKADSNVSTRQPFGQERKLKKDVRDAARRGVRAAREKFSDQITGPLGDISTQPEVRHQHKLKYRARRYELPTMASQMKQSGARYYQGSGAYPNIPFVVSKSTAPSHNIGVNIQQVLNGLKVQQPLTGIPPTIAHHMGLGHVSTFMIKNNLAPALSEHREINTIKLGRRLVRLPSQKYMSYNRALKLYREGDGMVPRFLRAISRPHYFYTSMYNLATTREDDGTSKANGVGAQEAKQSLAEYASLYREYEQLDKALREGNYEPEWERRRDEIWKELALREERVRKMVQDYKGSEAEVGPLRASASTAEEGGRRRSCFKLGDQQH